MFYILVVMTILVSAASGRILGGDPRTWTPHCPPCEICVPCPDANLKNTTK
jgi:hypothetical protein